MKLCMQVGLGPGHTVLDGHPPPLPQRGTASPQFSAHICCGQMAAWIKMSLGTEIGLGLRLREIVLDVDPCYPQKKGTFTLPHSDPCLLWPNGWMDERRCFGTE